MLTLDPCKCISIALSCIALALASVTDIKTMRVPNAISIPGIPIGLLLCAFSCSTKETIVRVVVIFTLLIVYFSGLLAGGDTKLLMTIAALNGPIPMLLSLLLSNVVLFSHWFIKDKEQAEASIFSGYILLMRPDKLKVIKQRKGKMVAFAVYLLIGYCITETALILTKIL